MIERVVERASSGIIIDNQTWELLMYKMHPSARKNIEEKADELKSLAKELPKKEPESAQCFSDEIVAKAISDEDMIGEMSECLTD